jgi:hypothetical protein
MLKKCQFGNIVLVCSALFHLIPLCSRFCQVFGKSFSKEMVVELLGSYWGEIENTAFYVWL